MFDEILQMVKDQLGSHPDVAALPADQQEALHNEIANHVAATTAAAPPAEESIVGGLLGKLESAIAGGGPMVNAIEGGLLSSLTSKFGLPPSVTGAIAGALPGLLQKFAAKSEGAKT